ncbi:MAG: bifunctional phosphoribosylaminoimidazolecarboxamide formyltransferase/IMP cyclohydrolase [Candidatus Aenigmarchaeota archaeon]|nr:bifunctional phosphoribosylaminoimidazolecarboxamide formyltransferase/IMP cyclohydrolase [Candidatus Aenigmarchaeota archaeon]
MSKIKRALVSVYDKTGIVEFCRSLHKLGVEIIATGGTTNYLKKNGIPAKNVSELTKFPEILDGRVKSLHPLIFAGILALREKKEHVEQLEKHDIKPIDMVVCNFYPFEEVSKKEIGLGEVLENIDIGGPSMVRSAAKNFENVVVIVNPERYEEVLREIEMKRDVSKETRSKLAAEAFKLTAKYDWMIQKFLEKKYTSTNFPEVLNLTYEKVQDLRYGENPHQMAALYKEFDVKEPCITNAEQIHGKKLSWTNVLDLNCALEFVREFDEPTVVIIKHTSPCGAACGSNIFDAFEKAYSSDPVSAFGGTVGANRKIDSSTAKSMSSVHFDCIIAPDYEDDALEILRKRKFLRILKVEKLMKNSQYVDFVSVKGGLLVQEHNSIPIERVKVVTKLKPTQQQMESMLFAWKVSKYVKSNAIVLAKGKRTVGIGLGQTTRVDAVKIAVDRSRGEAKGSVMASDGFFPFRDSIDEAAKAGIVAIIQPGGSIRDKEVIDAADEHGIAMVFTGIRAFRH